MEREAPTVPVLFLKTKSTPNDSYEELFSSTELTQRFAPQFVPVLSHAFQEDGLNKLGSLLQEGQISKHDNCIYGGLIFTSQRAVEAFTHVVKHAQGNLKVLQDIPIYSVGPATTRALEAVSQHLPGPLQVFGSHTGNGDALANFILDHYNTWYSNRAVTPRLLFLVGEQRRDIIPKTLMNDSLDEKKRISVDEEVVYGTGVMETFPSDFDDILERTKTAPVRWVVVFSPTGCDVMLKQLGMLDDTTKAKASTEIAKAFVATIGPTTRNYLVQNFKVEPHVCSKSPTPEALLNGILEFKTDSLRPS